MAAVDGALNTLGDKLVSDRVQTGSLLSLMPSVALHGAVAAILWLGLFEGQQVQPPATFISLLPTAAPASQPAPLAPVVPAPDPDPTFEPLPLPASGMVLPQPEPAPAEPVLDFAPPQAPDRASFPFDPNATRPAEPAPEDAVAIKKAAEKPKAKAKPKPEAKPQKQAATKAVVPAGKPAPAPAPIAGPSATPAAKRGAATPSAASPSQNAAVSDAPVRVSNPNYAGACPISYPERARKRNQQGTVVVHALIGSDGKPIEVTVARSSGHRLLDEAAQEAIADCAFVPQKVGGRAVKAIVEIPIPFKLI
jgi:protein TonB